MSTSIVASDCSICLEEIKNSKFEGSLIGRLVKAGQQLGCGHLFHKDCITKWLQTGKSCPNCRNEASSSERAYAWARGPSKKKNRSEKSVKDEARVILQMFKEMGLTEEQIRCMQLKESESFTFQFDTSDSKEEPPILYVDCEGVVQEMGDLTT